MLRLFSFFCIDWIQTKNVIYSSQKKLARRFHMVVLRKKNVFVLLDRERKGRICDKSFVDYRAMVGEKALVFCDERFLQKSCCGGSPTTVVGGESVQGKSRRFVFFRVEIISK